MANDSDVVFIVVEGEQPPQKKGWGIGKLLFALALAGLMYLLCA